MSDQLPKGRRWTAVWMLVVGALAAFIGANGVQDWEYMASALRGYNLISLVAGLALLAGGAFSLWGRPAKRWALLAGLVAALALGVNQSAGLWFKTIPCSSPG